MVNKIKGQYKTILVVGALVAIMVLEVFFAPTTVATAGATVVVKNTEPSVSTSVAAAPLNPYQPSQRMKTPSAAITRL